MRTTTLRGVLTVVVLHALSLAHASAQNLVRGTVYDTNKKPVEGAVVQFDFKERNLKRDAKTDRKGAFRIVGLPSGEYSVTAKMPDCADCYMYMGASLFELKRFDEAEAAFKKSIELQPTVEGYTALARFYNAQKQPEKAVEASQKATELSSGAAAAAPAAAGAGADAKTAASAAPVAAAGPSSEALYNEGVILWNGGKFADARPKFEMAVKANPQNADAHYMLGLASLNGGQMAPARAAFEEYLKIAPNGPKAAEVKTFLTQLPK